MLWCAHRLAQSVLYVPPHKNEPYGGSAYVGNAPVWAAKKPRNCSTAFIALHNTCRCCLPSPNLSCQAARPPLQGAWPRASGWVPTPRTFLTTTTPTALLPRLHVSDWESPLPAVSSVCGTSITAVRLLAAGLLHPCKPRLTPPCRSISLLVLSSAAPCRCPCCTANLQPTLILR